MTTDAPETQRPRRPWAAIGLLAALFAAQLVEAVVIFPTPRALLDDDHPVVVVDHAIHVYHGALGSRFLLDHGTPWGLDPYFMAGYPVSPIWGLERNPSILFQALAGGGYHPRAYNIGLVVCSLIALACLPAAAAAAGLGLPEAAIAALLGWLYLHCGWPDMFVRSGLFAFVTASCEALLLLGLLADYERRSSAVRWVVLAAWGSLLMFTHVTGPLLVVGGAAGFLAAAAWRHRWRWSASVVAAGLVAPAVNLFWLVPLWRFRDIRAPQYYFMAPDSARFMLDHYRAGDLESYLCLVLLVVGLAGLVAWVVEGRRVLAAAFGGSAACFLLLTTVGGQWSVTKTVEPLRFVVPLHLMLAVPAGSMLVRSSRALAHVLGGGRRGAWVVAAGWIALVTALGMAFPDMARLVARQLTVGRRLEAGLRPEMRTLVRCLRENTDPSARILFEDQLRLLEATDPESTHWTPLLPLLLGRDARQFIGGLYQLAFLTHHRGAAFGDYQLAGRSIDTWSPTELHAFCDQYNVGWVVCWSPLSRLRFDHWGDAHRVTTVPRYHTPGLPLSAPPAVRKVLFGGVGPVLASRYLREGDGQYVLYRIDRRRSFFLRGTGRLTAAEPNRIELADVVPEDGAAVLSMHWDDDWRSDPPLPLTPISVPNDPVPFIKIATPGRLDRLRIWNAYGRGP